MRRKFSNTLLQKVLTFVPLTATRPEVYVATMTTVLYDSCFYLVDTLKHMNSIKLMNHLEGDVADCCVATLVNVESLDSSGYFKPYHLGYIIRILEDTYNSRFHFWETSK